MVRLFQDQFYVDSDIIRLAIRNRSVFNLIHSMFVIKIDMVVRKDTAYRREEFSRRRVVSVEGHRFHIVAPEDLILSKLEWAKESHSDIQLADVRNLFTNTPELDREYSPVMGQQIGCGIAVSRGRWMSDTASEMARRFHAMLMARSGEERLKMGCSMHATARALIQASVLAKTSQATPADLRRAMFLRFYADDFDAEIKEKILAVICHDQF